MTTHTGDLAPPPVPAAADLRDFPFLPLDALSLRDSKLALARPEVFKATILLWCASWHQVPAGSLPDDDAWLARHSGADSDWPRLKDAVLGDFTRHADGRLYHPVIVEKVLKSWERKSAQRRQTESERLRKAASRQREAPLAAEAPPPVEQPVIAPPPQPAPDLATVVFGQGLAWLQSSTGKTESACRGLLGKWRKSLGGDEALVATLGRAQREGVIEPVGWIEKAIATHRATHDPPQSSRGWN